MKLILGVLALLSGCALAGEQVGKVSTLFARASDNLHLVELSGGTEKTGSPSCATHKYWLIKDEASVAGKSQFSQLLAAQMTGKKVTIVGSNTCSRWGDGEDINYILVRD
ncbi:hypothetical protein ACSVIJ_07805 [Pseudomonas sp. NCHU5208]|uniref:hypothetical protein n=1 Tax=unclassified Pseudomonas TaxID=196821 RepID=UPI003F983B2A